MQLPNYQGPDENQEVTVTSKQGPDEHAINQFCEQPATLERSWGEYKQIKLHS